MTVVLGPHGGALVVLADVADDELGVEDERRIPVELLHPGDTRTDGTERIHCQNANVVRQGVKDVA
jgi:hypothetical protein